MSAPAGAPMPLAPPPGVYLSAEQARRATCLALTLTLLAGRQAQVPTIERIAVWIYNGERVP